MALLRPVNSVAIDTQSYLKTIEETDKTSVEQIVKNYLFELKQQTTLSEVQIANAWSKVPSGIKPDERFTFEDVITRIESNPDESFSVSDVWVISTLITIISKFNRKPSVRQAIQNLNFSNGLNWSAFDIPSMYIAKNEFGEYILVSTKGGHRSVMAILVQGFSCNIPCRITYIGTLELEAVCDMAALDHHIDCNKRANQTANDRIISGTEANDYDQIEVMQSLIDMNLYVDKDKMKPEKIQSFRKITSWQSFKISIKDNGYDNTSYAVEQLIKHTNDEEAIISQSVEVVANFRNKFKTQIDNLSKKNNSYDVFADFLQWYFSDPVTRNQSTLRQPGDTQESTLQVMSLFNSWSENVSKQMKTFKMGWKRPITHINLIHAYGGEENLPKNFRNYI
jgi:hypothetical protein